MQLCAAETEKFNGFVLSSPFVVILPYAQQCSEHIIIELFWLTFVLAIRCPGIAGCISLHYAMSAMMGLIVNPRGATCGEMHGA